jgi:hypothetical protein
VFIFQISVVISGRLDIAVVLSFCLRDLLNDLHRLLLGNWIFHASEGEVPIRTLLALL